MLKICWLRKKLKITRSICFLYLFRFALDVLKYLWALGNAFEQFSIARNLFCFNKSSHASQNVGVAFLKLHRDFFMSQSGSRILRKCHDFPTPSIKNLTYFSITSEMFMFKSLTVESALKNKENPVGKINSHFFFCFQISFKHIYWVVKRNFSLASDDILIIIETSGFFISAISMKFVWWQIFA